MYLLSFACLLCRVEMQYYDVYLLCYSLYVIWMDSMCDVSPVVLSFIYNFVFIKANQWNQEEEVNDQEEDEHQH